MAEPAPASSSGKKAQDGVHGMDPSIQAEYERQKNEQRKQHMDQVHMKVIEWIERVTGAKKEEKSTLAWLKDGKVLCKVINCIVPGKIAIKQADQHTANLDNIYNFLRVAESWGVAEHHLFAPLDLFEETDLTKVVTCLHALGSVVPDAVPYYQGPQYGGSGCCCHCPALCDTLQALLGRREFAASSGGRVLTRSKYSLSQPSSDDFGATMSCDERFDRVKKKSLTGPASRGSYAA